MSKKRKSKSWQEKLMDGKDLPKVVEVPEKMTKKLGAGAMVIPAPSEVDEIMKMVPRGQLITINQIREILAHKHGATIGCPLTTGIFTWIAAHAAEEQAAAGKEKITPYWRTLKSTGELNEKYPGGVKSQSTRLKAEGHVIEQSRGKRPPKVKDFEKCLFNTNEQKVLINGNS